MAKGCIAELGLNVEENRFIERPQQYYPAGLAEVGKGDSPIGSALSPHVPPGLPPPALGAKAGP